MFSIIKATQADIPLIRDLCFKVWPQTYAAILSQDKIDYMLELMYSPASLQKQIEQGSQFLLVYEDKDPVGFAAYLQKTPSVYKLDKIYVLPSQQGKGTGKFVIDYIIDEIKKMGGKGLQLQVHRQNKAINFYEKLGFTILEEKDFDIGNGFFMNDFVMELQL
ncbi:MAG TPA: GNAT family N-acetyltransferase [Chitinophagaceae bacterium]|nr:GNAT family N-acetyltransferase [Chitinophagaceae bacterium]